MWMKLGVLTFVSAVWGQVPHQHHPPSSEEYAKVLEDPSRDAWQKPHEVVMALDLKPTDVVADIGAGTGYFARRFARHAAKVYAVDIDKKLLEIAVKDGPDSLVPLVSAPDDPKLPAASLDLVFICDVLHHIENRPAYLEKLKTALKPGGRLVILDFFKKELPVGPPPSMKLDEKDVRAEISSLGFISQNAPQLLPYQYFLIFTRP